MGLKFRTAPTEPAWPGWFIHPGRAVPRCIWSSDASRIRTITMANNRNFPGLERSSRWYTFEASDRFVVPPFCSRWVLRSPTRGNWNPSLSKNRSRNHNWSEGGGKYRRSVLSNEWTNDGRGTSRLWIKIDGLGIDGEIVSFFFSNTQAISKGKVYHYCFDPFSFFFFFGLHGATNFFYSIGFLYFAPPPRPPLYFFFSGHVKIFARRLCDNRRRHRTTSLYIFFSSFRLLLPPPTPYHTFATTLLFIF